MTDLLEQAVRAVDARLDELLTDLRTLRFPVDGEVATAYIRAAYGKGYSDAMTDTDNLLVEVPLLSEPTLLLPPPPGT